MSDAQHYRTKDEVTEYQKIDPITTVLEVIKKNKYATEKEIEKINQEVKEIVTDAVKFAEVPFPTEQDLTIVFTSNKTIHLLKTNYGRNCNNA